MHSVGVGIFDGGVGLVVPGEGVVGIVVLIVFGNFLVVIVEDSDEDGFDQDHEHAVNHDEEPDYVLDIVGALTPVENLVDTVTDAADEWVDRIRDEPVGHVAHEEE